MLHTLRYERVLLISAIFSVVRRAVQKLLETWCHNSFENILKPFVDVHCNLHAVKLNQTYALGTRIETS